MESLKFSINPERLPKHIAIIMDGNGRWAKGQGQDRLFGHYHGVESVRNMVEACAELGVGLSDAVCFFNRKLGKTSKGSERPDGITGRYDPKGSANTE